VLQIAPGKGGPPGKDYPRTGKDVPFIVEYLLEDSVLQLV
jgi:hypothetical protein